MPPSSPPIPPTVLRRTFRLFWCHYCRRPVVILSSLSATSDILCPRCFSPFVHDLDIPSPLFPPPFPPANFHFEFPSFRRHQLLPPWSPFHSQPISGHLALPPPPPPPTPPPPPPPPINSVPPTFDLGDYFTGPNLSELIQELTENDRTGPPPASNHSIDALPTVEITAAHLRGGSECPVCKEEFLVGEEAREMPCRHVYHSDCIIPWLRLHNSCPVCRLQLSGESPTAVEQSREHSGDGRGGNRRRRQVPERWNPFTMLPAFGDSSQPGWERRRGVGRQEQEEGDAISSAAG